MASVCARLAGFAVVFVLFVMLSPLAPGVPRSASAVPLNSPLTPPNFAFSVNGAQMLIDQGTLSSYESWLQSENWTGVTDYLYHQPVDFLFVQYCWNHACTNDTQDYFLFNVEIYEFANTTAALNEFNAQYPYKWFDECTATACPPGSPYMTEGPIFTRFVTWNSGHTIHTAVSVQQLIQRSNFMFFIYYIDPNMVAPSFDEENATYNFTNAYINGLFSVIPGDAVTSPPPSGISPSAPRWGLQVGDNITWTVQKSGCVGNVLSGGACNNDNYDVSLQVVEVADGGRAVEVEGPSQNGWPSDFNVGRFFN